MDSPNREGFRNQYFSGKINSMSLFILCQSYVNISFIFFTLLVTFIGFILHIKITSYHIIISLLLTIIVSVLLSRNYFETNNIINLEFPILWLIFMLVCLLFSLAIATNYYDISWDGQAYHQGTILSLLDGWNPIFEKSLNLSGDVWINHYPKAAETSSAVIVAFTGHIEDGKLLNIFLIISTFLICFSIICCLYPKTSPIYTFILSTLLALNPVSIYQSVSYYIDGQMASLLSILVFLLMLSMKRADYWLYLIISFVVIYTINVKFTGIIYAIIILIGCIIFSSINHKKSRYPALLFISLLLGIIIGYNPYITNTIEGGNPFYPLVGGGEDFDIMTHNTPTQFLDKNQIERFLISIFSETSNVYDESCSCYGSAVYKLPFTISRQEIDSFYENDLRIGGFGPLFSGIFIISAFLVLIILRKNNKFLLNNFILFMCFIIFVSVIINPESWWARYVPHLWIIPILLFLCSSQILDNKFKIFSYLLIIAMIVNILIITLSYYSYQSHVTGDINSMLDMIKYKEEEENKTIKISFIILEGDFFNSIPRRLTEHGIKYVLINNNVNKYNVSMPGTWGRIKIYL
jgi:hypothetical protein